METSTVDMEAVKNEVRGMKTALIEGFDEMKDVLVKVKDKIEENPRKRRRTPSGDKENIIVAGGDGTDSVEMFNWCEKTWSPLQSMPKKRWGATSFVYNNHVTIAGGSCSGSVDDMIGMDIHPSPDPSMHWNDCPFKLPAKLANHSSVLYNDHLIVTGGGSGNTVSKCIHEVRLVPPYTSTKTSDMPEQRQHHSTQLFDDSLLIVGGRTTENYKNCLSSVVLYDIKKKKCKQLAPLPYKVSMMATVRWGDNIVIIGGVDKNGNTLDKVIIYNVVTEKHRMLPSMRYKRYGCSAVVVGNNIVVLGGSSGPDGPLKSAEAFNFESRFNKFWEEFPEMSQKRRLPTAVVV